MDLEMTVGCLASGGHRPCMPGVQCFSRLGSHHSPSFSSWLSPSCGTSGGGRSPVHCSMVMAERHLSPGNWQRQPCHPFWGWPWRSPCSRYHLHHCWACCPRLWQTSWRQARGTPSCGCAELRKIQRPASDTSHIRSWHCNA